VLPYRRCTIVCQGGKSRLGLVRLANGSQAAPNTRTQDAEHHIRTVDSQLTYRASSPARYARIGDDSLAQARVLFLESTDRTFPRRDSTVIAIVTVGTADRQFRAVRFGSGLPDARQPPED
jgi:hypothetical protein